MSDQPIALRLAEVSPYLEGGERGQWIVDAAAELRRLHAANVDCVDHYEAIKEERDALLEALKLALDSHGRLLMSDPPQDPWKVNRVEEKARAAIAKAEGA